MKSKTRQRGLSPKVLANFLTTLAVGAAGYFAVELSPEVSGAIAVVAGFLAGVIIGPGDVEEVKVDA